jgi:hypothetical protein
MYPRIRSSSVNFCIRTFGLGRSLRVPLEVGRVSPPDCVSRKGRVVHDLEVRGVVMRSRSVSGGI